MKSNLSLAIIALLTLFSGTAFCAGEIKTFSLPEGGKSPRAVSVYLPEGYNASGTAYPVLYLLHGNGGDNFTFLGGGYANFGGAMKEANVGVILEELVQQGSAVPLIVVCPDITGLNNFDDYLLTTVVPYVDSTFRTIPSREGRAIAGHSLGGYRALSTALAHPEMFRVAGGFSSYIALVYKTQFSELAGEEKQRTYPVLFWLYAGSKDQYGLTQVNRDVAAAIKEKGLATTYKEDDGDHISSVARNLAEFLKYLGANLRG